MQTDAPDYIHQALEALYCGHSYPKGFQRQLEFIDPLVRVHDTLPTLRMFERLRGIFPHTEITKLNLDSSASAPTRHVFDFEVLYKRSPSDRGKRWASTLTVESTPEQDITLLQEDWRAPFNADASSLSFLHPARRLLGTICGL